MGPSCRTAPRRAPGRPAPVSTRRTRAAGLARRTAYTLSIWSAVVSQPNRSATVRARRPPRRAGRSASASSVARARRPTPRGRGRGPARPDTSWSTIVRSPPTRAATTGVAARLRLGGDEPERLAARRHRDDVGRAVPARERVRGRPAGARRRRRRRPVVDASACELAHRACDRPLGPPSTTSSGTGRPVAAQHAERADQHVRGLERLDAAGEEHDLRGRAGRPSARRAPRRGRPGRRAEPVEVDARARRRARGRGRRRTARPARSASTGVLATRASASATTCSSPTIAPRSARGCRRARGTRSSPGASVCIVCTSGTSQRSAGDPADLPGQPVVGVHDVVPARAGGRPPSAARPAAMPHRTPGRSFLSSRSNGPAGTWCTSIGGTTPGSTSLGEQHRAGGLAGERARRRRRRRRARPSRAGPTTSRA